MTPKKRRSSGEKRSSARRPLPLVSSNQIVAAMRRLGFHDGPSSKSGSHMTMWRERPGGGKDVTIIVLGRREIPRGTLRSVLALAKVTEEDFRSALK